MKEEIEAIKSNFEVQTVLEKNRETPEKDLVDKTKKVTKD